jgi:hypothetical protein
MISLVYDTSLDVLTFDLLWRNGKLYLGTYWYQAGVAFVSFYMLIDF